MKPLSDTNLLQVWEHTQGKSIMEKCLTALALACPENTVQEIAALPIGVRDAQLLQVRENLFGSQLFSTGTCPACNQKIEWESDTRSLRMQPFPQHPAADVWTMTYSAYQLQLRLPNSEDLLQRNQHSSSVDSIRWLISRCIIQSDLPETILQDMPDDLIEAIENEFSSRDPQADITLQLTCPSCRHEWQRAFDIMIYVWTEIQERVRILYQEIVLLASHFHWTEYDILRLSRFRRQLYLRLIQV